MSKLVKNEVLMLNIGSMCTGARVIAVSALGFCKPFQLSMNEQQVNRWLFPECCQYQDIPQRLCDVLVQVKHDLAKLQLTSPVCTKEKEKIALSRRVEKHWRLIGWGSISAGRLDCML